MLGSGGPFSSSSSAGTRGEDDLAAMEIDAGDSIIPGESSKQKRKKRRNRDSLSPPIPSSPTLRGKILKSFRTNRVLVRAKLNELKEKFRDRMARARERRAEWLRNARARGRCTCKCGIVPHMHGNPFPPFGVAEVIFLLFTVLMLVLVPLKAMGVGNSSPAWSPFTEYTIFVFSFFATFGLRQLFLQSILLVFIIAAGSWALTATHIDEKTPLNLHLMGALALIGLALGWGVRYLVIAGTHWYRPPGVYYEEFLKRDGPRRTLSDVVDVLEMTELEESKQNASDDEEEDNGSTKLNSLLLEWERDEVGLLPTFSESERWSFWQGSYNWVPSLRVWEAFTIFVLALCWILYGILAGTKSKRDSTSSEPTSSEVALHVTNYLVFLLSLSRFDARRMLWTTLMALALLAQIIVTTLLAALIVDFSQWKMVTMTFMGMCFSTILWSLRCFVAWKYFGELKREGAEARLRQWSALKNRQFKTGDILLTGSSTDPTAIVAEWGTLTAWGHTGCILSEPAPEVRVAFVIGYWLCRLPIHLKRPLMKKLYHSASRCHNVSIAAVRMAEVWKMKRMQEINGDDDESEKLAVVDLILETFGLNEDEIPSGIFGMTFFGLRSHEKRYPIKIPRSPSGYYVAEAVGHGSRLVSLEGFMNLWCVKKKEKVAFRPMVATNSAHNQSGPMLSPGDAHRSNLDLFQDCSGLVGKRYPLLFNVYLSLLHLSVTSDAPPQRSASSEVLPTVSRADSSTSISSETPLQGGCAGDAFRGGDAPERYFCSTFVCAVLQKLSMMKMEPDIRLGDFMPRNFVDESTGHSVVSHLESPWLLGPLCYLTADPNDVMPR